MAEYKVMWEIDIEADSPREAAEKAKVWQQTGSWVGVFDVTDEEGTTTRVDLDEDDKDAIETFEAFSMREEGEEETVAPMMFRNHYECQKCEHKWTDDWSAQCDDDCPNCGCRAISPTESEDIDEDGNVIEDVIEVIEDEANPGQFYYTIDGVASDDHFATEDEARTKAEHVAESRQ